MLLTSISSLQFLRSKPSAVLYSHFGVEDSHNNIVEGRVVPCMAFEIYWAPAQNISKAIHALKGPRIFQQSVVFEDFWL